MNVLFISNDPTIFDTTSESRARMRAYASVIGELHILSTAPATARDVEEEHLHLHPVHVGRLFRAHTLTVRARALIAQHGIEVVSAQDPFEQGLAALGACEGTGAKLHIQVHTDFLSPWFIRSGNWRSPQVRMPLLNRWRRSVADRVLPQAHGIRVVSERIKASLIERYGSRIVEPTVIPIAVDAQVPEPIPLPTRPFTFSLIAVGRLEPEKRVEDILAALKLIAVRYPMVGLIVVGEGRERSRLERMTRALGLTDRVIYMGSRPNTYARALLSHAQAFIQASAYEGYGRTLIEAALAKVPIITTDVGIVGEVLRGYEEVLAVPVADPTALSLAIVGLIEDNAVRQEFPVHALAAARAHLERVGDLPTRIAADLRATGTSSHQL
jgi:glycosyltransferase involved in cell wall biosynthesis